MEYNAMTEFLLSSKKWITEKCQDMISSCTDQDCCHVILGNEAADLDSVVSSLVYGFFLKQFHLRVGPLSDQEAPGNCHFIPIINCPRRDYILHTEVVHALEKMLIRKDMLVFIDDIDLPALKDSGVLTGLSMVDHNVLSPQQMFMKDIIVKVIDHHEDAAQDLDDRKKVIEPVGSCCTLVAEQLLKNMPDILTQDIATLLVTTILTDTFDLPNVERRDTEKDQYVIKELSKSLPNDALVLYKSVHSAKFDNSLLTAYDLLRKDCKYLKRGSTLLATSSVMLHINDLISRQTFKEDLVRFCEEMAVDVLIILCIKFGGEDTLPSTSRQIGFWSKSMPPLVDHLITQLSSKWNFMLEAINTTHDEIKCFKQNDPSISRKILLPILSDILSSF